MDGWNIVSWLGLGFTLKTNSSPLRIDGWNTYLAFGGFLGLFSGARRGKLFVSGVGYIWKRNSGVRPFEFQLQHHEIQKTETLCVLKFFGAFIGVQRLGTNFAKDFVI